MSSLIISKEERRDLRKLVGKEIVVCKDIRIGSEEDLLRKEGNIFLKGEIREIIFGPFGKLLFICIRGAYYPYKPEDKKDYVIKMIGKKRPRIHRFIRTVFFEGKKVFEGDVCKIAVI